MNVVIRFLPMGRFGGRLLTGVWIITTLFFLLEDESCIEGDRRFLFLIIDLSGELDLARSDITTLGPSSEPLVVLTGPCRRALFM